MSSDIFAENRFLNRKANENRIIVRGFFWPRFKSQIELLLLALIDFAQVGRSESVCTMLSIHHYHPYEIASNTA